LRAGYAEIVKYGLIRDAEFFDWLEAEGGAVCDLEPAAATRAILTSCRMKAVIVAADEREEGDRALLNFGHTFGHALEAETGFGNALLHGEAVALGMALAFDFSARLGLLPQAEAERVKRHLGKAGLPTHIRDVPGCVPGVDALMDLMAQDKKVKRGRLTFILVRAVGAAFVAPEVDAAQVRAFLADKLSADKLAP
jgi:3-dehydroquinate synthetase